MSLMAGLFCAALLPVGALSGTTEQATPSDEPAAVPAVPSSEEFGTLEPPVIDIPASPRRSRWYGRAGLGLGYRWAFGQSMLGAALDGELGAQNPRLAGGVRLHLEAGQMQVGLSYQVVTFGPTMWFRLYDRVRVGGGIDAGAFLINRRTMPGRSMWTVMFGGHVHGAIDLWRVGATGALQLNTSVGAYALTMAPGPLSLLTTLGLGYKP